MTQENRRPNPFDPTDERTADPSTPGASGLPGSKDDHVVNRDYEDTTPRRYDRPADEEENPTMPGDEATLRTEI